MACLLGAIVATASFGCGGEAQSDAFNDAGGSGGSGGNSGASGGTATGGGSSTSGPGGSGGTGSGGVSNTSVSVTNGGPSTTGTATTAGGNGGGGGSPDRCSQPIVGGECEAAIPSFGYNTETGACEDFLYGGCGGNDNRFQSLDACLEACDPGGRKNCESSTECVIDHGCCGLCGIDDPADLVAVNQKYAAFQPVECGLVDCLPCLPPAGIASYGARCSAGSCEVYDVRKSPISECKTNDDCRLRAGLGCCTSCGGDAQWVAVSTDHELVDNELCGGAPVPCPECVAPQPENMVAVCGTDGHCAVETLLD